MAVLELIVPGDPIAKGRPRTGANNNTFTPKRTKDAEKVIAAYAAAAMDGLPVLGEVGIAVEFYCATRRATDGDNLLKLVTDALNKIAYADDSQILEWFARVHRGVGKDAARTEIYVWELD